MAPAGGNAGGPGVSALRGFSLWRLCRLGSTDRHTHDIREKRRSTRFGFEAKLTTLRVLHQKIQKKHK
jgi:hypothetical protein